MGLIDNLVTKLFRKEPAIGSRETLADFIDSRASFLSQKCVVEFCRVRSGVYWQKLFSEAEFRESLRISCWNSYPPATAMIAEMVEGVLRPAAGLRQRHLPDALMTVVDEVFARHQVPVGVPETFWADGRTLVRERLDATQAGAPRPVRNVAQPMAKLIHQALPLHPNLVSHDYDYIRNNLRMNLLRAYEDFVDAADLDALARDLLD